MKETIEIIKKSIEIVRKTTYDYRIMICEEMPATYIKLASENEAEQIYNELGKEIDIYYPWEDDKRYIEIDEELDYSDYSENPEWRNIGNIYFYSFMELDEILA